MPSSLSRAERRKLRYGPGGTVRVLRPDGSIGVTSSDQAHAYEAEARGAFGVDGIFFFFGDDHRNLSAAKSASRPKFQNGDGFAALEAIAGLPCIQPLKLLTGHRPEHPPRDYPSVEISRQALSIEECTRPYVVAPWPLPKLEAEATLLLTQENSNAASDVSKFQNHLLRPASV